MQPDLDAIAALQNLDMTTLYKELAVTAIIECRKYGWSGSQPYEYIEANASLNAGESPQDLASKAITDTVSGKRKWNKDNCPNIKTHLRWVIKSLANNLANTAANDTTTTFSGLATPTDQDENDEAWSLSPEDRALFGKIIEYDEVKSQEFISAVIDELDGDKNLESVLDYSMAGLSPAKIAENLNLPISQTYQLTRKLKRKIQKVIQHGGRVTGGGYDQRRNQ